MQGINLLFQVNYFLIVLQNIFYRKVYLVSWVAQIVHHHIEIYLGVLESLLHFGLLLLVKVIVKNVVKPFCPFLLIVSIRRLLFVLEQMCLDPVLLG